MKKLLFLPVLLLLFAGCKTTKKTTGNHSNHNPFPVDFYDSEMMMPVFEKAAKDGKLVFVDFFTEWCAPCKLMDREVYMDKKFAKYMNNNFVSYRVDCGKGHGKDLIGLYNIEYYPTLIFMDADGNELVRKVGAAFQAELREMGDRALEMKGM